MKYIALIIFSSAIALSIKAEVPLTTQGVRVDNLQNFGLQRQLKQLDGYQMRARRIFVEAGGSIAEHGHSTRPGIVYVESGSIVEYRGGKSRVLNPGDTVIEDADTVHAYQNIGKETCVLIAVDIPKTEGL